MHPRGNALPTCWDLLLNSSRRLFAKATEGARSVCHGQIVRRVLQKAWRPDQYGTHRSCYSEVARERIRCYTRQQWPAGFSRTEACSGGQDMQMWKENRWKYLFQTCETLCGCKGTTDGQSRLNQKATRYKCR